MPKLVDLAGSIQLPSYDGVSNNPFRQGLGVYYDVHGNVWDVRAVIGSTPCRDEYVCARLAHDEHVPWDPYRVELVQAGAA